MAEGRRDLVGAGQSVSRQHCVVGLAPAVASSSVCWLGERERESQHRGESGRKGGEGERGGTRGNDGRGGGEGR